MAPRPVPNPINLTPAERSTLERWARGRRVPRRLIRRARIVLRAAEGLSNAAIARALRTDRECVGRWRARFAAHRLAGLQREAPRPGRPPVIPAGVVHALVTVLTSGTQPDGRPWSTRRLARLTGVSSATIHRCCQASGIAPHWVQTLRLRGPFPGVARLQYVLGGYLTEVDSALVVGGDVVHPHRPDPPAWPPRTRGPRPPGLARYAVAVPPVARVVAGSAADNRVLDWLQFLTYVVARVPRGYWVHVVADNAVTHQHPAVPAWLARHPQVVVHLVGRDRPLPRWFLAVLQQWVRPHLPPPPPPVPQTLPKWLVRLLQERGTLRLPRNRLAEITSLRAAIGVLRPRSVRRRSPSFWMASKPFVRCCGNPRWGLPPDPWGWGPAPRRG